MGTDADTGRMRKQAGDTGTNTNTVKKEYTHSSLSKNRLIQSLFLGGQITRTQGQSSTIWDMYRVMTCAHSPSIVAQATAVLLSSPIRHNSPSFPVEARLPVSRIDIPTIQLIYKIFRPNQNFRRPSKVTPSGTLGAVGVYIYKAIQKKRIVQCVGLSQTVYLCSRAALSSSIKNIGHIHEKFRF